MKKSIPAHVNKVLDCINSCGFEAYIVGGAVRDLLMGRQPVDWDIATNARPDYIEKIFENTVDTGIRHGTVTVIVNGDHIEVTTYRTEQEYSNRRRPDTVSFVTDLELDTARRDFTINSIAYNVIGGLKDYHEGVGDINRKLIRCVGDPSERFKQDALRLMRAVRLAVQLNFEIEENTYKAIKACSELISFVSAERIRDELNKILVSDNVEKGIHLLSSTGLLGRIIPELEDCRGVNQHNPHHDYDVFEHIVKSTSNIKPELQLRLTMILHDLGKSKTKTTDQKGIDHFYSHEVISTQMAKEVMERLRYDNKVKKKVVTLVRWHDLRIQPTKKAVKKAMNKIGLDHFCDYLLVREADIKAQSSRYLEEKLSNLGTLYNAYQEVMAENEPLTIKDLNVDGNDLMDIGVKNGKDMGAMLEYLLGRVLDNPQLNRKEILLRLARSKAGVSE